MTRTHMIGLRPSELGWVRLLVSLLRHRDPVIPELARQALHYLEEQAAKAPEQGDRESA